MTLKQLEVFLAVAATGSFSRAGEAVSLAQSTVSQHIRSLEEELEARLLDRSATQVSMTEAGQLFHRHATLICSQCGAAREEIRRFQGLEQATLRLGASTIPASCLIPELLGRFTASWPGVRLELQQGDSRDVIGLLRDNRVELAVVGWRYDGDTVFFQEVLTDRIALVGLPEGRQPAGELSIRQLQEVPLILREQGSGTRQATDRALQKAGIDLRGLRVVAQLGSSEAVRRAVLSGAGVSFLSTFAVGRELAEGTLVEIKVTGLEIVRSFYLARRRSGSLSPAAEAFIQLLSSPISFN